MVWITTVAELAFPTEIRVRFFLASVFVPSSIGGAGTKGSTRVSSLAGIYNVFTSTGSKIGFSIRFSSSDAVYKSL